MTVLPFLVTMGVLVTMLVLVLLIVSVSVSLSVSVSVSVPLAVAITRSRSVSVVASVWTVGLRRADWWWEGAWRTLRVAPWHRLRMARVARRVLVPYTQGGKRNQPSSYLQVCNACSLCWKVVVLLTLVVSVHFKTSEETTDSESVKRKAHY